MGTAYWFYVFKGKDGQWYWRFYAPNNRIVAIGGEGYQNKSDCVSGLNLVASYAPGATIKYAQAA
jgi:uncharacterized protein YegP (UPF0339 family)